MKEKKYIIDTTLRDGEQSPFVYLSAEAKLATAQMLDGSGVYQIEAGISAAGVEEQKTIEKIIENRKRAKISVWSRLNADDVRKAIECRPDIVHVSIPVSYLHIYTKLGKNKPWVLKKLNEVLDIIDLSSCKLSVGFEDALRADLSFVIKLLAILEPFGTEMIRVADTVGISSPSIIKSTIKTIKDFTHIPIEIHAHNDLGMALANTAEALKSGALYADTTLLGIGERTGNCNMAELIRLMSPVFDMGIDIQSVYEMQEVFSSQFSGRKNKNSGGS